MADRVFFALGALVLLFAALMIPNLTSGTGLFYWSGDFTWIFILVGALILFFGLGKGGKQ